MRIEIPDLDALMLDPEVALLVAEARRDLREMVRTAQIEPIVHELEEDLDDDEDDEEICEDCGYPVDDCRCERCPNCGEKIEDCECERCENCGNLIEDCGCDRCPECNELEQDCECERCSDCGQLLEHCECERCSDCNELVDDCECEKCPDCDRSLTDCTCDYRDPTYLRRLQRAMKLGLNIFSRVAPAYGPIADAMAYYLSGKGGDRRLDVSIMSEGMRRRMVGKALAETDWLTRLNSGDSQPATMLWDYADYSKVRPGHVHDQFSAENAANTEPLHYVAGGFTYQVEPRPLRDGSTAIDVHLEDVYDFANKKDDAQTTYDLETLSPSKRILQIAESIAKRFVGDLVTFTGGRVSLDDRMLSAMADEGIAAPFRTVIDGTLMVIPPGDAPLGDRVAEASVDDFSEFDHWSDGLVSLMLRVRPQDVRNAQPRQLVDSKDLSVPTMAMLFRMRANPEDVEVLGWLDVVSRGQEILEALLPVFAGIDRNATMNFIGNALEASDWRGNPTPRNERVQAALVKLPQLDPRRQMTLPFEQPVERVEPPYAPTPAAPQEPQEQPEEDPPIPGMEPEAAAIRIIRTAAAADLRGAHDLADRLDRIAVRPTVESVRLSMRPVHPEDRRPTARTARRSTGHMSRFARIVDTSEFRTVRLERDGRTFDVRVREDRIDEVMREAGLDPVRIRLYPSRHSREHFAHIAAIDRLARSCEPDPPEIVEVVPGDTGFSEQFDRMWQDRAKLAFRFPSDPNPRPSRVEHVRPQKRGLGDLVRHPGQGSYRG